MMKKMGLIGGTSWHSTVEYYRIINQRVNDHFGNNTNPPLWLYNLNQQEIHQLQQAGQWEDIAAIILKTATQLQGLGVEALALCANTPHKVVDQIQPQLTIPFLHIADAIGMEIKKHGWQRVGLLGTKFTMAEDFIKGRLARDYQTEVIVPEETIQQEIHRLIVEEMSYGNFSPSAKVYFQGIIQLLADLGAQAVILGCTEIPLLLQDVSCSLPTIDSLACHCDLILTFMLGK
jgi:aspartate racemase